MGIYAFLFSIAAFGIVWYGILIYFGFLLIIGLAASPFLQYTEEEEKENEELMSMKLTLAVILFIFIGTYFVRSAFPHGWNNLQNAYYNEYKYHTLSQEESIFAYRSDYLTPIATMNLKSVALAYSGLSEQITSPQIKQFLQNTKLTDVPLETLYAFIMKYRNDPNPVIKNDVKALGQGLFEAILYPSEENANTGGIYRIGTFMTYLINNNRSRYFDDSLVMAFRDYFYDPSPEITIDRMRKM
jgi:hypothetical protein